jgi:nucleoside-diphosphate-sugar epimerase
MEPARGFGSGGKGVDGAWREHLRRAAAQVHDTRKQGLLSYVTAAAREKRVSAYIGDGANRWPAAHVSDVARLYRLAFAKAEAGAIYHAVDEEGVSMKAIAEALGRGLKVPVVSIKPEEAEAHFGWLARFRRAHAREAELEANWAGPDRRPGRHGLHASLIQQTADW